MADRMLQFFSYQHLPDNLKATSMHFAKLAYLIETKDCAVRAVIYKAEF